LTIDDDHEKEFRFTSEFTITIRPWTKGERQQHWCLEMLRQRHDPPIKDSNPVVASSHGSDKEKEVHGKEVQGTPWFRITSYLLHAGCCLLILLGRHTANRRLHTAQECDMTWSRRRFLHIALDDNKDTFDSYRLFRFTDTVDPRTLHLYQQSEPLTGDAWCSRDAHAVLYIPGHSGSYEQARSLGAHGVQHTLHTYSYSHEQAWMRHMHQWTGRTARNNSEFVFDVYAVDFREQATGLHGTLMQRQSAMVRRALWHLIHTCHLTSVYPVAHSVGGMVLRLALVEEADLQPFVPAMITLGTPHAFPVLGWDASLYRIYARIHQQQSSVADNDPLVISISGGWRDEMVPPMTCYVSESHSLSVLASRIMTTTDSTTSKVSLGMDHRSLVWCHNVLTVVRSLVFALVQAQQLDPPRTAPDTLLQHIQSTLTLPSDDSYSYMDTVDQQTRQMEVR
jgi:hypothetical protein